MSNLYEIIVALCNDRNTNPGKMCNDLKLSRGIITDLKMGRKKSLSAETFTKISNYFDVPIEFILGNQPFEFWEEINSQRKKFIKLIHSPENNSLEIFDITVESIDYVPMVDFIRFIASTIKTVYINENNEFEIHLREEYKKDQNKVKLVNKQKLTDYLKILMKQINIQLEENSALDKEKNEFEFLLNDPDIKILDKKAANVPDNYKNLTLAEKLDIIQSNLESDANDEMVIKLNTKILDTILNLKQLELDMQKIKILKTENDDKLKVFVKSVGLENIEQFQVVFQKILNENELPESMVEPESRNQ